MFGGVFDVEFDAASRIYFEQVRNGAFRLVLSDVVRRELEEAPAAVRELLDSLLPEAEIVPVTASALALRQAYLRANIVTEKWLDDALHVALATVAGCDGIVSWNFKHIVHFQKIPLYNAVNTLEGYGSLLIHSPREVIDYGRPDEDI